MSRPDQWAMNCERCGYRRTWTGSCHPIPPCPKCSETKEGDQGKKSNDVEEAIATADEIISLVDDLPEEGEDFGISVAEKTRDIRANIEAHNRVTKGQMIALENMLDGVQRWFHD